MPQASFPPLPGSLPHYYSGRASPERYDNRYEQGFSESFVTTLGKTQLRPDPECLPPRRGHNTGGYYRMNAAKHRTGTMRNFRELRYGEVCRNHLLTFRALR